MTAAPKPKITEPGQLCWHCDTPVVLKRHTKEHRKRNPSGYFFEFWLVCPDKRCKAQYMPEAGKRYYDRPGELLDAFDVAPAKTMLPRFVPRAVATAYPRPVPVNLYNGDAPPWEGERTIPLPEPWTPER